MKRVHLLIALMLAVTTQSAAQDANIQQIQAETRTVSRNPEGDRHHYGLRAKDLMMKPHYEVKPRFASVEDSLLKHREFEIYHTETFYAYQHHEAEKVLLYGDSALSTGFDSPELYFYMAGGYEWTGNDEEALKSYKMAKAKGFASGGKALSEFRKRQKARRKAAKEAAL